VNGLAPGYVATKLTKISRDNEKIYEGTLKTIPLLENKYESRTNYQRQKLPLQTPG